MIRSMTIPNETGDGTIAWTEENDSKWEAVIRQKMAEGVTFFILEPRLFGMLPSKRTKLTDVAEAMRHRALVFGDEDIDRMLLSGDGTQVKTPIEPAKSVKISRDPKEVAQSQSIGTRQLVGG